MKFKLKPLSVAMFATVTVLAGCSSDNDSVDKTAATDPAQTAGNGFVQTAGSGLTCKSPDIVQVIDSDFYPLTQSEKDALRAAVDPEGTWTAEQVADWNSDTSSAAYDYDYDGINLYQVFASADGYTNSLGLTKEEQARQATAKVEAREFKASSQNQAAIFGDDFDTWFDSWFAGVALTDYLGESQRLQRAKRGFELSLSSANDTQEVCYTPPTSCPNFQIVDDSGTYSCITPVVNPLADDQPNGGVTETMVEAGKTRVYFKAADHVDGESGGPNNDVYKDIIIHAWNDPTCTAYTEESTTGWSQGPVGDGIDPDYGMYWDLGLAEGHDPCGNIIVYNKVDGDQGKKISTADLKIPLGNEGSLLENADKQSYFMEGVNAINYDGDLFGNQHPLINASSGTKSCGWGTELNESGEACVGQVLESCPTGTVAVGVYIDPNDPSAGRQEDIASKCVVVFDPDTAPDLYVRGAFHDAGWGADDNNRMAYAGNGVFQLNFAYNHADDTDPAEAVSHGFKVADENWTESTNFGGIAGADAPSVNGSEVNLTVGENVAQNITVGFISDNIYQFVMDASTPEAPTLKVATVPVDAFPKISIGDLNMPLEYVGEGVYSVNKIALEVDTYTIVIADPDNNFAVGAGDVSELSDGEAVELVNNGGPLSYEVTAAGDFDFTLDLSDVSKPMFTAKPSVPYGANKVFIRGTMTGWGDPAPAEDELVYDADSSTYSVIYGLEGVSGTDKHQFKFASQAWGGALDLGPSEFDFSTEGETLVAGGNIEVQPATSTAYEFSISFANGPKGVLKVEDAPIYIRGGIYGTGDWGTDDTMRLNFEPSDEGNTLEAGHVYSSVVTTTGPGFFKIADADWGGAYGFNYGTSEEQETSGTNQVQLGVALQLVSGGDSKNISFQHPAGTYRFSFDDVTKQITVTSVE